MPKHYTREALAALDANIAEAEHQHSKALRSMGDDSSHETWHDNPAFDQAKQDVDMTRATLKRLQGLREEAITVEYQPSHVIEVGSTVRVQIDGDVEPTTFSLAGHYVTGRSDSDSSFMLSTSSPLGAALVGRSEGEYITYDTPSGKTVGATIIEHVS